VEQQEAAAVAAALTEVAEKSVKEAKERLYGTVDSIAKHNKDVLELERVHKIKEV
jgi:hypothetical protein